MKDMLYLDLIYTIQYSLNTHKLLFGGKFDNLMFVNIFAPTLMMKINVYIEKEIFYDYDFSIFDVEILPANIEIRYMEILSILTKHLIERLKDRENKIGELMDKNKKESG